MAETLKTLLTKSDAELVELCAYDPTRKDRAYRERVREGVVLLEKIGAGDETIAQKLAKAIETRANERTGGLSARGAR